MLHVAVISRSNDDMDDEANHKIHVDVIGMWVTAQFDEACLNTSKMKKIRWNHTEVWLPAFTMFIGSEHRACQESPTLCQQALCCFV